MNRKTASRSVISILLICAVFFGMVSFGSEEAYASYNSRRLWSKKIGGRDLCVNLRNMLGEKAGGGYSVVQGSCTDGTCVYYLMVSSSNQRGRVLKVRLKDHAVVKRGPVVDVCHGNGMTYDSNRHRLVVVGCEHRRCELVTIDADTLRVNGKKKIDYSAARNWKVRSGNYYYGLSAIAYIPEYDCFVSLQRNTRDLLVLNADFKVIGMAKTRITSRYSGTYQAMDADTKYVYLLMSEDQDNSGRQPYNQILAIDWNSENLFPYVRGGDRNFAKVWNCNNNKNGREDAVIRIKTNNEAESLYHTTDRNGREHFYMAEYCPYSNHAYVTKKSGQKVKKRLKKAYRKDDYVYDLGILR